MPGGCAHQQTVPLRRTFVGIEPPQNHLRPRCLGQQSDCANQRPRRAPRVAAGKRSHQRMLDCRPRPLRLRRPVPKPLKPAANQARRPMACGGLANRARLCRQRLARCEQRFWCRRHRHVGKPGQYRRRNVSRPRAGRRFRHKSRRQPFAPTRQPPFRQPQRRAVAGSKYCRFGAKRCGAVCGCQSAPRAAAAHCAHPPSRQTRHESGGIGFRQRNLTYAAGRTNRAASGRVGAVAWQR